MKMVISHRRGGKNSYGSRQYYDDDEWHNNPFWRETERVELCRTLFEYDAGLPIGAGENIPMYISRVKEFMNSRKGDK